LPKHQAGIDSSGSRGIKAAAKGRLDKIFSDADSNGAMQAAVCVSHERWTFAGARKQRQHVESALSAPWARQRRFDVLALRSVRRQTSAFCDTHTAACIAPFRIRHRKKNLSRPSFSAAP